MYASGAIRKRAWHSGTIDASDRTPPYIAPAPAAKPKAGFAILNGSSRVSVKAPGARDVPPPGAAR